MRRFRRVVLLFALLGLIVVPGFDQAKAQTAGGIVAVAAGISDASGGPTDLTHIRREGAFTGLALHFTATRGDRTVDCRVDAGVAGIAFRTRENAAEGRGFVNAGTNIARGDGTLVDVDTNDNLEEVHCEVSFPADGQFHRIGTAVVVELPIDVRATRRSGDQVFEHRYCLTVAASAVPLPPNFNQAAIAGSGAGTTLDCIGLPARDGDTVHG